VAKKKELALRDRSLLEAAANGMSAVEMSEKFGMSAIEAAARVRELLAEHSIWDEIEERKLLMQSLYFMKEKIENFDIDLGADNAPKFVESYMKLVTTINDLLERQNRISEEEMNAISKAQARVMMEIIAKGYMKARAWLEAEYGQFVQVAELDRVFEEGMLEASYEDE